MNTKKNVLIASVAYIIFFIAVFLASEYCDSTWCRVRDDDPLGLIFFVFLPLIPTFFLSLITYKMHDEVFRAWWGFARWWVLVIIAVTLFLQNAGGGGGIGIGGAVSGAFDVLVLGILYAILIITSLVKIVRAFLKLRWEERGISGDKLKDFNISLTISIIATIALILIAGWFVLLAL